MLRILFQPFPTFSGKAHGLRMSLIAGVCVFGVLTLLKPFNLHEVEQSRLLWLGFIYGLTSTVVSAFVTVVVPMALPRLFNEQRWTVLHEIIAYIVLLILITLANGVVNIFVHQSGFSLLGFISMLQMVLSVGVLPITIGVLVKQKRLFRKFHQAANDTDKLLGSTNVNNAVGKIHSAADRLIVLSGNNKNELLEVLPANLLLITASDNYVEICFLEDGKLQKRLFRNTLKSVQESLTNYPEFFRTHKTHLVNLKKAVRVTGNAQGLKLHLADLPEPVPVSRNLTTAIKEKLSSIR